MRPINRLAQAARIKDQIVTMECDANNRKWRRDVDKYDAEQEKKDAEQAKKDQVAQANKAIKDRRGIK